MTEVQSAPKVTWLGASCVLLEFPEGRLMIDPYLCRTGEIDYILITREDHDHCHEPTLERLTASPAFKRLVAPEACTMMSKLDTPSGSDGRDLAFVSADKLTILDPKYLRKPDRQSLLPTEIRLDGFHVEAVESNEYEPITILGAQLFGKRYRPTDGTGWPAATGGFVGVGRLPPVGYMITEDKTRLGFYHPSDLQEAFDSQRELRGRVDYLFLPLAPLEGAELTVVDNVRPRFVIPIHYRVATSEFPIPLNIDSSDLTTTDLTHGRPRPGVDPADFRKDIQAMIDGYWYASPAAPLSRLRHLEPQLKELGAQLLVLTAGQPHDLAI